MTDAPHIGLLPCFLALYDRVLPDLRDTFTPFLARLAAGLEARGMMVTPGPICCVADEFAAAIQRFETSGVDCLVTLHLAYSPSLEAIDACCATDLPLVLLDTSMDADFGVSTSPDRILTNHGVHGVMDLASVLRRRRRPFEVVAGHDSDPLTLDRVAGRARGCTAARRLQRTRALRVGPTFAGMGDFAVDDAEVEGTLGIAVDEVGLAALDRAIEEVSEDAVTREVAEDRKRYACELSAEAHARSARVGLGLRRLLAAGDHGAFSVNFAAFDTAARPANTMPFLEISKAMGRGLGYAGEGDVLTAALVGALARSFGPTTFTEIFCADWQGNALFLSHMGELSPSVVAGTPRLIVRPAFGEGPHDPAVLTGPVEPGPAVFVNLAPGPDQTYSLIVAPVEVLPECGGIDPQMGDAIRAWVQPEVPVAPFLEAYARAGGTHHSALVLGAETEGIAACGRVLGLDVVPLGAESQSTGCRTENSTARRPR